MGDLVDGLLARDHDPHATGATRAQLLHERLQVEHEVDVGTDVLAHLVHHKEQAERAAGRLGAALVYWLLTARKNTTARKIAGMAVGMFVCYLFGTLWYVFATGVGLAGFIAATAKCVLPFIVPDAMKCVLAFWLAKKIRIKK